MFLFGKKNRDQNEDRACMLCQHCTVLNNNYICKFKGEVDRFYSCRKYLYDITKKKPMAIDPNKISELSEELGDLLK